MRQKFTVIPSQTQERLDLFPVSRSREVKQRVDLLLTRPHSVCQLNSYKDIMQMVQVIVPRTTKYHNIIQISFAIILKTLENFIYEPTERCWRSRGWRVGKSPLNLSIADLRSYLSYITYHRLICICMPESPSSTQRSKLTAVSN